MEAASSEELPSYGRIMQIYTPVLATECQCLFAVDVVGTSPPQPSNKLVATKSTLPQNHFFCFANSYISDRVQCDSTCRVDCDRVSTFLSAKNFFVYHTILLKRHRNTRDTQPELPPTSEAWHRDIYSLQYSLEAELNAFQPRHTYHTSHAKTKTNNP